MDFVFINGVGHFFPIGVVQSTPHNLDTLDITGYTSQGSLSCPSRSAGFDLTGPADFLSAQSHTELRLMDLQIYRFFNKHVMIIKPATYKKLLYDTFKKSKVGFRQHSNKFRAVLGLADQTKKEH